MNANDVIESYVCDVASCLPRHKRNDIAFELRALLTDELAARAQSQRCAPDKTMAMDLLKGFGRPADAASRYYQRPAVIEATDTRHFLIWACAGALVLGVHARLTPAARVDGGDQFLQWLGILVIVFALMGWWRRRQPADTLNWKPRRVRDLCDANRLASIALSILSLIPFFMYAAPKRFAEIMFLHAIYTGGLVLDDRFQESPLRIATLVVLSIQPLAYAWAAVEGRWRRWLRWSLVLELLVLAVLVSAHTGVATQNLVFVSPQANATAAPIFALTGAGLVLCAFYGAYQEWAHITPAPALEGRRV